MTIAKRLITITSAAFFMATAVSMVTATVSEGHDDKKPTVVDGDGNQTLTIEHVSSTTSSITIRWTVHNVSASINNTGNSAGRGKTNETSLPVRVEATSLSTKMTLTSPPIHDSNSTTSTFTLPELAVDSAYLVCVKRNAQESACATMRTIPTVRLDSVLAVLLTIAFIIMLILIAVVCWRCAIYCASRTEQEPSVIIEEEEKTCNAAKVTGAGEDNVGDEKAPLLVTGGSPGQSPNSDQQQPDSLYLYLTGPALDYK